MSFYVAGGIVALALIKLHREESCKEARQLHDRLCQKNNMKVCELHDGKVVRIRYDNSVIRGMHVNYGLLFEPKKTSLPLKENPVRLSSELLEKEAKVCDDLYLFTENLLKKIG